MVRPLSLVIGAATISLVFAGCATTDTVPIPTSSSSSSISSSQQSSMANDTQSSSSSSSAWVWDGKILKGKHRIELQTSKGSITLELNADAAPKTVTNFLALASSGYFEGLTFHRVIPGFMIQGGDPNGNGTGGHSIFGATFEDEIDASSPLYKIGYKKGVIAMANRGPDTNGSQFFIMDADYPLPPSYTIFGHVVSGQDVVSSIARTERGPSDRPTIAVTFSVRILK